MINVPSLLLSHFPQTPWKPPAHGYGLNTNHNTTFYSHVSLNTTHSHTGYIAVIVKKNQIKYEL